jgi:membrane-bound metal-dependent hydrolase YbcI (DUF457 family)
MPFTPYHFGPAALIGLPLKRWIDIPVFVLANVVIDLEPLAVMVFNLDYPLHGYLHTFLFGGLVGLVWGLVAYPLRPLFAWVTYLLRPVYKPTPATMMLSGLFSAWLHILFDAVLYKEMNPFWPIAGNPLHAVVRYQTMFVVCEASLIVAAVVYPARAYHNYRKTGNVSVP